MKNSTISPANISHPSTYASQVWNRHMKKANFRNAGFTWSMAMRAGWQIYNALRNEVFSFSFGQMAVVSCTCIVEVVVDTNTGDVDAVMSAHSNRQAGSRASEIQRARYGRVELWTPETSRLFEKAVATIWAGNLGD